MTQSAIPRLETPRLALRPLAMADARPMTPLANDPGVSRMTTAIPHPFAQADAEGFIDRMNKADPAREQVFAVERADGVFMGVLGLHPNNGPASELGYWLGRPYWGWGYMTEAVAAALAWAGRSWGRRALTSGHFADNPASGAVLVKSGFLYTGQVEPRYSAARGETAQTRMMIWLA
ncbi:MAG TPA: GNAT family N-acetyltransferase [Caulobacteraceae bacterium]|nr:GNAT family N-acetyltransferase [Caulobacteraceae bacterium]